MTSQRIHQRGATWSCLTAICLVATACNSSSGTSGGQPGSLNISLSTGTVVAQQNGRPAMVSVTVTGNSSSATLAVNDLPNGTTAQIIQPSGNTAGTITLTSSAATAAGMYTLQVTATSGGSSGSQNLALVVAVSAAVSKSIDTNQGVNGKLEQFMSTSFQPAEWDYQFFTNHPSIAPLTSLGPQHIRIQGVSQAVPMKANSNPQQPADWDFSKLDAVVQPILSAADHSPEFQIAVAPSFMNNAQGQFDIANHLNDFVQYCANLVSYYNTGGFTWGGQQFKSASANKITWWGIFNEYNINGLSASQYVQLYNAVVPAMLNVDPTIKFSALELSDFDSGEGDPRNNLPTFVATTGGVNAPVNIVSTHFYSSCNQQNTDTQLFATVPGFVSDVGYFYQELQTRPDLAAVPVWVTENNVNADFDAGNGMSACNPGQTFVTDLRGTSAFFAAWRPYVFSQLGKAGNQALYHWDYDADQQFGEVDYNSGNIYLSYWVDLTLGQIFPSTPVPPEILSLTVTDTTTVEALATMNSDGSAVVMIADRAVHAASDNNGSGDPRTVVVDVSALGNFSSATSITIDANTNSANGPSPTTLAFSPQMTITLGGYGVTFLTLKP